MAQGQDDFYDGEHLQHVLVVDMVGDKDLQFDLKKIPNENILNLPRILDHR